MRTGIRPITRNEKLPLRNIILGLSERLHIYFFTLEILLFGRWAEDVWPGYDMFSRSGAVVALMALFLLWLWLRYNAAEAKLRSDVEFYERMMPGSATDFLKKVKVKEPVDPNVMHILANVVQTKTRGSEVARQLGTVGSRLGYAQIEVAAIGTTVWAFGDLLV